ncbi:histidine phosphatase family protein [Mesorhizobium sp. M2D.F.Ca.ET.185.01.1.1]|uniref:histidine phosphatase family protein n=1 Tax=unclassified Mesorhizobium TaxID=325217 RepID=UPI000FCCA194|nr:MULTISPECIES: histidine phosphatase family protein [unclassified Mesorhizobium]TGP77132.1 histidine phosphatase family protein [bacterium M00.F.Ca.ET.227.01.1.1]TGP84502.1 histidine phosphatase family protein [bacterium M00.F.Ca.ET.221.01.1.1]TGP88649.1 histidine phosphatase family protein [bacterium M00.F.Ca.ET.222.01.1.1]TGT98114.1 histidine phosphatase family protein [bacterium M00.F.Ca.ET.163.01.1.1]TGU30880.1 histidine phosphatase family protein [bacterium M00.F.Ca.ET.156.01.1.1]TGU45
MLARLTMIACGATPGMRKGRFPSDEPLEPRALERAAGLGSSLRRADRVWTSPALAARLAAEALGLEATVEPLLAEQDFARWAGRSFEEMQAEDPQGMAAWFSDPDAAPHGGESLAAVARRVATLMERLAGESGHTIAFTHAVPIRAAIVHVLGAPLASVWNIDIEPLSLTEFRSDGRRWVLHASGVTVAG